MSSLRALRHAPRRLLVRSLSTAASPTAAHVADLRALLPPGTLHSTLNGSADASDLEPFNTDWMRKYRGSSAVVVKPRSTAEVSTVLAYCNKHGLPVVPQGGNTGLVGACAPPPVSVFSALLPPPHR